MKRASAQIAFAPCAWLFPAWAALPWAVAVTAPVPFRRVMIASFWRPASKTRQAADPAIAAVMMPCPSGEPTSSSPTTTTRIGVTDARPPVASSAFNANAITTRPPFMSSTPGPRASAPSRR